MALELEIFGRSDIGRVREANEDNFLCLDLGAEATPPPAFPWLLAVADGIGGHTGGAVASDLAVRTLKEEVLAALQGEPAAGLETVLERAFQQANRKVFETAAGLPNSAGMGTTLVALLAGPERAVVSNVGDSRAYLFRDGALYQITKDHSWASEQRKMNILTPQEIEQSPFRTLVTRSLGYENEVKIDSFVVELEPGDDLFLCTDGLYGPVPEKKIRRIFNKAKSSQDICTDLVDLANKNGGPDNITAVVGRLRAGGKTSHVPLDGTLKFNPRQSKESEK